MAKRDQLASTNYSRVRIVFVDFHTLFTHRFFLLVVFHHGEKAEGGHYTVDIFHGGQWVHVDDTKITPVNNDHVLNFVPPRVPYLLFYRRWDTTASDSQQQQR